MSAEPQPGSPGRVLTVFGAKGGCGKTTLATNLAVILNAAGTRRVCLVDLDLAFGDVAGTLDLQPRRSLGDAVGNGPLDAAKVANLVTPIWSNLDGIFAPMTPGGGAGVPPSMITELLAVLPSMYRHIVIDTPAHFSGHVLAALDASTDHVLITTPERPALRNLRITLDMLDLLGYRRKPRSVVLNRGDSRVGLTDTDIHGLIRTDIAGELPSSKDVPASINRGVPLSVAQPEHLYSKAVARLVKRRLAPTGAWPW